MKTKVDIDPIPSLRKRVQEWDGLAVNVLGGVGDSTRAGRPISEIKAKREKLRAERRATQG